MFGMFCKKLKSFSEFWNFLTYVCSMFHQTINNQTKSLFQFEELQTAILF